MVPRCLARQACLALCAGVAAFALIGCGGSPPAKGETSTVEKACRRSFHDAVAKLQKGYNDTIVEKCKSLRQSNEGELGTEERRDDFEQKCATVSNADAALHMEALEDNYTAMCMDEVTTDSNASHLDDLILDFEEGQNLAADLDEIVAPQLERTYANLIDGISSGGDNSSESGSEGGSSGNEIVITDYISSGGDNSSESGSEGGSKLFEDSVAQWGGNALSSSSLRLTVVSVAGLAAVLLVATWATAKAVRRSQRRTSYTNLARAVRREVLLE